ncbi:MAG: YeaH/YhbH family protein [Azonexus sp.]|nr:YeaH/YhbH family protein [Betaproteobacteria bacterium]MBK8919511.1 YeaH/YhbH family protein [Betaproteobacteria bacterium]MBP6036279.1 YeaH/YhbH family protein [Azonexus sp.]MBP6906857.1 YeaH/YhbH family protein [Azonexus sp.]
MTVRIVDRRQDSKNKSSINRSRFIQRFKGQIRKSVADAIAKRGIRDLDNGEKIGIPGKDISEPHFRHGRGGKRDMVHPGNDRFNTGDQVERPLGGGSGQGKGKASNEGEGLDDFVFTLTRDEFLDIFFDELALPNLIKRQLARVDEYKRVRAGYTQTGVPTNINLVRTMRGAAGRRVAVGGPYAARLRELQEELDRLKRDVPGDPDIERIEREIACLKARREAIPFIDPFDLRFSNRIRIPQPSTQAVMFCLMDVSGSMDEQKKQMAKRFFMLLYLFLNRNYEKIEVVFIRHHTAAEEVDEENFFHSRETGGTIVSSALKLMQQIIAERYSSSLWNIYGAQASDGDNWNDDSPLCRQILGESILPCVQYFAYIEITEGAPQNLWLEYERLQETHPECFALQRIGEVTDIYPVFRELFHKRLA